MIYKSFAVVTLIAAPIIVLTVQSFVPQTNHAEVPMMPPPPGPAASSAAPAPPPVQAVAPPAPVSDPGGNAASFGQPIPEAGKPSLAPGAGLPAMAPAPAPAPIEGAPKPLHEERR